MGSFSDEAAALVAVCGELTDDTDLIAATRVLREVCAEHDEVDARFYEAYGEVERLLQQHRGRA